MCTLSVRLGANASATTVRRTLATSTTDMWSLHRARAITTRDTKGGTGADNAVAAVAATKRLIPGLRTAGGDRLHTSREMCHVCRDCYSDSVRFVSCPHFNLEGFLASVNSCGVVAYSFFISIFNLAFRIPLAKCSVAMRSFVMLSNSVHVRAALAEMSRIRSTCLAARRTSSGCRCKRWSGKPCAGSGTSRVVHMLGCDQH